VLTCIVLVRVVICDVFEVQLTGFLLEGFETGLRGRKGGERDEWEGREKGENGIEDRLTEYRTGERAYKEKNTEVTKIKRIGKAIVSTVPHSVKINTD
jgi:hypothetical protein